MKKKATTTALITGGSSGIGLATARLFTREGIRTALLARDEKKLREAAEQLDSVSLAFPVDVRDATALARTIENVEDTLGPVDVAVVNAGIGLYGPVTQTSWTDVKEVLRVNVEGAIFTAGIIARRMIVKGGGSIVFVSSILGKRAMPNSAVYSASKYALQGFADAFRLEMEPHGIHVAVVLPPRTDTPFHDRMVKTAVMPTSRSNVPSVPADVVAEAVLRAWRRRKREVVVSLPGKLFTFVGYHFPRLGDILLRRHYRESNAN
ncbi:MAG: SDR family NAD(P)-dependent oxidoreductase [Chlorobi bacterium]|nr:SDR family NAD(P)-dependent oxidoreductase [Chlorobiota bacterium]